MIQLIVGSTTLDRHTYRRMTMPEKTLDLIEPETSVKILKLTGQRSLRKRILDMGLTPGTKVEVMRRAPLGDPVEFKIKGYNLSLRKKEAQTVLVETVE
jgi:ferrous iron transport protein A